MTLLSGFRHHVPVEIRFGDLDALGHVNNARYLTYMETARVRYFRDVGLWRVGQGEPGVIVAKATVDFKRPLDLYDQIEVYTRVTRLGTKSMDADQWIVRHDGEIAALGQIVMVVYDYTARVSVPIPDHWRETLAAYEPALAG